MSASWIAWISAVIAAVGSISGVGAGALWQRRNALELLEFQMRHQEAQRLEDRAHEERLRLLADRRDLYARFTILFFDRGQLDSAQPPLRLLLHHYDLSWLESAEDAAEQVRGEMERRAMQEMTHMMTMSSPAVREAARALWAGGGNATLAHFEDAVRAELGV